MVRAIWRGSISFGLVSIPVSLFAAEKSEAAVHLHLLDKKSHTRIHNQRVNELGEEVAWEDIDHAYEFEKGQYVVVDPKQLEQQVAENHELIQIAGFVPLAQIEPIFFEKPYYLIPSEYSAKSYVLLHDILQRTKKVGIARVVLKTREHMAVILPQQQFLVLITLRYARSLRNVEDLLKGKDIKTSYKISAREMKLAEQLVETMSGKWKPLEYHDESREMLLKTIKSKIKSGKSVGSKSKSKKTSTTAKSAQIVDFSDLLKRSVSKDGPKIEKGKLTKSNTTKTAKTKAVTKAKTQAAKNKSKISSQALKTKAKAKTTKISRKKSR